MAKLTVSGFSCIDHAELELGAMTVIIGPQASGKSVLSKLTYFFVSLLREQSLFVEEGKKIDAFKEHIREKFNEWFPPSAWGCRKFCINFNAGAYEIRLMRSEYKGKIGDRFRITLSSFIEQHYQSIVEAFESVTKKAGTVDPRMEYEISWKIRDTSDAALRKTLGNEFIASQLFVPAGRSFFTSIGKAVVAFEQTRMLDPLTALFGRNFASFRERFHFQISRRGRTKRTLSQLSDELLGGSVRLERNKEYVETADGRKIPFSALSSGQQELLPLLLILSAYEVEFSPKDREKQLIYIEEPEAHLFPNAQSALVVGLTSLVVSSRDNIEMVMTTHSPYVLSKLNNLLKAGQLGLRVNEKGAERLQRILPRHAWLNPKKFRAYAIIGGSLKPIIDEDGLINGEYLDDVSSEISREFSSLIAFELDSYAS